MLANLTDGEVMIHARLMVDLNIGYSIADHKAMIEELSARLERQHKRPGGLDLGGTRRQYQAPLVIQSDVRP
jgi:hypothetical protein